MIVERIIVKEIKGYRNWLANQYGKDTYDIMFNKRWNKENTFRIYGPHVNIDASIIRGKFALTLPDIPIGDLVGVGYADGKNFYFDDPFWNVKFGKSCVFTNDAPAYELFVKGKRKDIHPTNTEKMLITQLAMKRVFESINIDVEFFTDADVYLLPSRDKFSCGFSRAMYIDESKKENNDDMVRYEGGWISYYIDHDLFQQILPPEEYNRDNSHDPNHAGIDGIENKYPTFDREKFIEKWIIEISNILGDNITKTVELVFE